MRSQASIAGLTRRVLLSVTLALAASGGVVRAAEPSLPPITVAARDAFWIGDFAELERQNAILRQPGHIQPSGVSQLTLFRRGLNMVFKNNVENAEAYLKELDILTLQWASEHPESAFAHVLHADSLVAHAWSYRGGGYMKEVPPEAWKDFHAYLRRAAEYLHAHADVALTDSYAHDVLLTIGKGLSFRREQMLAIANEGLKRNPDDFGLYFAVLGSLMPKWGGDPRTVDNYIKSSTEQTRDRFGQGMYTSMYLWAAYDQFGHTLFEDSYADWDRMKQGFEDLLVRYSDNVGRLNGYAYMACLAKDKDTFLKQFGKIGKQIDREYWGANPERTLESCRRWATSS
jgi:hypothetical protein